VWRKCPNRSWSLTVDTKTNHGKWVEESQQCCKSCSPWTRSWTGQTDRVFGVCSASDPCEIIYRNRRNTEVNTSLCTPKETFSYLKCVPVCYWNKTNTLGAGCSALYICFKCLSLRRSEFCYADRPTSHALNGNSYTPCISALCGSV